MRVGGYKIFFVSSPGLLRSPGWFIQRLTYDLLRCSGGVWLKVFFTCDAALFFFSFFLFFLRGENAYSVDFLSAHSEIYGS